MVIDTFKSKEQLKAEKYMEDELAKVMAIRMPDIEVNAELLTTNVRSAVTLLLDEPLSMGLGFLPIRRVSHSLARNVGGETSFSQMTIDHLGYSVNLSEGMITLPINDKFKVLIARDTVKLAVDTVSKLSLNEMSQKLNEVHRLGDDGVGYVDSVKNVAIYLVYADLFKIVDHSESENSHHSPSEPDEYSVSYFASNVSYSLCKNNDIYVIATTSKQLLKDTLALFYHINSPQGHSKLGLEAVIRNEIQHMPSRSIAYRLEEVEDVLYGRIYTYYVDPETAELICKLISIDENNEIAFQDSHVDTHTLSDGQELKIEK